MKKLWKGFTAAALVLAVAPLVGVTSASEAEAAETVTVKAAAASTYNPTCENPDGSYNGGVCKTIFPAYEEDLSDEPKHSIYLEWPGKEIRNYTEQVAHMNSVHNGSVAECKSYVPHSHRTNQAGWNSFCDGLPKPKVEYFEVKNAVTGEVR